MSCKNKKNKKKNKNEVETLLVETVKKEAARPTDSQNSKKNM